MQSRSMYPFPRVLGLRRCWLRTSRGSKNARRLSSPGMIPVVWSKILLPPLLCQALPLMLTASLAIWKACHCRTPHTVQCLSKDTVELGEHTINRISLSLSSLFCTTAPKVHTCSSRTRFILLIYIIIPSSDLTRVCQIHFPGYNREIKLNLNSHKHVDAFSTNHKEWSLSILVDISKTILGNVE